MGYYNFNYYPNYSFKEGEEVNNQEGEETSSRKGEDYRYEDYIRGEGQANNPREEDYEGRVYRTALGNYYQVIK